MTKVIIISLRNIVSQSEKKKGKEKQAKPPKLPELLVVRSAHGKKLRKEHRQIVSERCQ